jgi:cell filamentation protein
VGKYSSNDDYLDAKTGVMKNKLGFENQAELEAFEGGIVAVRTSQLAETPLKNRDKTFDLSHMQRIHKHLFGDIYEWAGYFIDWTKTSQEQMIKASIEAYHGQSERMGQIILDNLKD